MTGYNDRTQLTITARKEMNVFELKNEIERASGELYALFTEGGNLVKATMSLNVQLETEYIIYAQHQAEK